MVLDLLYLLLTGLKHFQNFEEHILVFHGKVIKLILFSRASSMGGLVVKQMLFQAKLNNHNEFLHNTAGIVSIESHHV